MTSLNSYIPEESYNVCPNNAGPLKLGDSCIQNFHLGRYIVRYKIWNLILQRRASRAVKHDFRLYNRQYTSLNENFEYGYPHSNAIHQFPLKLKRWKAQKATHHSTKCDIINDVKLFPTVYHRIYCRNFLTLSNQTWHYKSKCIRMLDLVGSMQNGSYYLVYHFLNGQFIFIEKFIFLRFLCKILGKKVWETQHDCELYRNMC